MPSASACWLWPRSPDHAGELDATNMAASPRMLHVTRSSSNWIFRCLVSTPFWPRGSLSSSPSDSARNHSLHRAEASEVE
eukprot:5216986-Alexandrium_andersonii.AAC.1